MASKLTLFWFGLACRDTNMAHQTVQQSEPTPDPTTSCCERTPGAGDGFLHSVMGGIWMVLSIVLFLGICVFSAHIGLLCVALLVASVEVLFTSLIPSALPVLRFLLCALLLLFCLQWMSEILSQQFQTHEPLVETRMAHQRPLQWPPTPVPPTLRCQRRPPASEDGLLASFMGGVWMVLSIILLLGICAFTTYVGLLCVILLIDAVQVLFTHLIPSMLLILHFLLCALLLLFCLQWMSEILSQQFWTHKPLV
uniref:Uncharacterized protein n=1 Tax=Sphaerodactylus townsendi TaxID=933632 RepID=A0ACB8E9D2_9SAUR